MTNNTNTWLDLGHILLTGSGLKRELNETSTKFMTGCVEWLEKGYPLSPKQSESYVRNINIHLGTKFSMDTMVEADGVPEGQSSKSANEMDEMVQAVTHLMVSVQVLAQAVANIKASSS